MLQLITIIITLLTASTQAVITKRLHSSHIGTSSLASIRRGGDTSTMMSLAADSGIKAVQKNDKNNDQQQATDKVNQDGHDIAYFLDMSIGSSGQNFSLVVDTGSYYTWVYGANCTADACTSHERYDSSKSKTSKPVGNEFDIKYTSGDMKGVFFNDQVQFAGFDTKLDFGVANEAGDIFQTFPIDGILGLSAKDKDSNKNPGILESLKKQDMIEEKVFGVNLGRSADPKDEGSITFGGTDKSKYTGDIHWVDVIDSNSLLWIVPIDNSYHGNLKMDFGGKRNAIIDTGSTLLTIPPGDAEKFHSYFKGAKGDSDGNYVVPCDSDATLTFEFDGKKWEVPAEDYISGPVNDNKDMCSTLVRGLKIDGNSDNQWLVGDVFLKNVYSVFDVEKQRVGFAKKTSGPTETTPKDTFRATTMSSSMAASQNSTVASGQSSSTMTAGNGTETSSGAKSTSTSSAHDGHKKPNDTNSDKSSSSSSSASSGASSSSSNSQSTSNSASKASTYSQPFLLGLSTLVVLCCTL